MDLRPPVPAAPVPGLRFHHLGMAARDAGKMAAALRALGYTVGEAVRDPLQNVDLVLCASPGAPSVEIVSPTGTPGPVDRLLAERGEHVYHTCWETDSIEQATTRLRSAGIRALPVAAPCPAVLFGGRRVAFFQVPGLGLVELLEAAPSPGVA